MIALKNGQVFLKNPCIKRTKIRKNHQILLSNILKSVNMEVPYYLLLLVANILKESILKMNFVERLLWLVFLT